ncbi:MAG: aminotransferase class I/II-fold pyridoxal phosphate-dependent enzyme, partial [Brevibacterium aurantiacum]
SKYWAMTGWRLGWAILPESLASAAQNVTGNLSLCAPVPAQYAAVAAFTEESYAECETAVESFARARKHVLDATADLGFSDMAPPDGAFYMYARIDEILQRSDAGIDTATDWCQALLETTGVALAPGDDFDSLNGSRSVRLSLAVGADKTAEALDRILDFMR